MKRLTEGQLQMLRTCVVTRQMRIKALRRADGKPVARADDPEMKALSELEDILEEEIQKRKEGRKKTG